MSGFVSGFLLTSGALLSISRCMNPKWYKFDAKKHKYSNFIEESYSDHIKSGDAEYEIFEINVRFENGDHQAKVIENGNEYAIYRKFW